MQRPVIAVHQPNYLPWLGFFAKAAEADVFVLLDDVQFSKQSLTNRVRVKTPTGTTFLTVPIQRQGNALQRIDTLEIAPDPRWVRRHVETLRQSYGKSPGWERLGPALAEVLGAGETRLAVLNEQLLGLLFERFGIDARVVRASANGVRETGGSAALADLCERLGARTYLSGSGGRKYNDPKDFDSIGVELAYSRFEHPQYGQPHGDFVPGLSAVDLLFSEPDGAAEVLRSGIGAPLPHGPLDRSDPTDLRSAM